MLFLCLSLVWPVFPHEQWLQHLPTVVAILLLAVCARKQWLTTPSFACLVALLWLHILGARYIYSYVPYDQWAEALCGTSVSDWCGWQRNHYDRLVHLCFGALLVWPVREVAARHAVLSPRWALLLAVMVVITISAAYEIFEWMIAVVMSPHNAEAYNGQQGDFWDSQKDMALALAGSLVSVLLVIFFCRKRQGTSSPV